MLEDLKTKTAPHAEKSTFFLAIDVNEDREAK